MVKWAAGRKKVMRRPGLGQGARCVFGERCGSEGFGEGLHGCGSGSGSGISRDGGSMLVGENGYQAWAIMSPYGSEGTY